MVVSLSKMLVLVTFHILCNAILVLCMIEIVMFGNKEKLFIIESDKLLAKYILVFSPIRWSKLVEHVRNSQNMPVFRTMSITYLLLTPLTWVHFYYGCRIGGHHGPKRINKIEALYTLEGTVLENVDSIKYLGVTITNDLKWNTHINNICTKANRTLGFLRRNLFSCPQDVKEAAYKGLVRPVLEYGSSVWDPHTKCLQEELEKVQNRAARFVTRNYTFEEGR